MTVVKMIKDGLANVITGLGLANVKVSASTYTPGFVDQSMAEMAYDTSTWFGKIVEIPADDATREWREWQAEKADIEALEKAEAMLQVRQKVRQALIWSRLYGGAVLIPGGLPGRPDEPLSVDRISQNSVQFLSVLHRYQISAHGEIRDPLSAEFGQPEYYQVNSTDGNQIKLHPSRVILINGRKSGSRLHAANIWGDSIWSYLMEAVMASDAGAAIVHALMHEAKIDVVRVPNMMQSLGTTEYESLMIKRFQLAATLKSISNVLLLDKDDEWDQKQLNFNGLPQVVDTLLTIMSGAADIPKTRLLGEQQSGLSGSDSGSLRHYYDSVKANQELKITPQLYPLDQILQRTALGRIDPAIWYKWAPLWQMTDKERAEVDKLEAEAVMIYANTGLIPQEALAVMTQNRLIESSSWPGADTAYSASDLDEEDDPDATEEEIEADVTIDAAPRTLYVHRKVLNGDEILAWAKEQGFKLTLPADDLHVTIAHSRTPVDWMKIGTAFEEVMELPAGGPRLMERFGEARVLLLSAWQLNWRHHEMREAGASWDHEEYQPHITLSYDPDSPWINDIEPYRGRIILGPEIFEEVNEKWVEGVKMTSHDGRIIVDVAAGRITIR